MELHTLCFKFVTALCVGCSDIPTLCEEGFTYNVF